MKRSILISLLVIGAAAALLGAGTFATWTTSGSDSGTITAGGLAIQVKGSGASLAFSGSGARCPNKVMPGDICNDTVTVTNNSTTNVTITAVDASESGGDLDTCGDGDTLTTTTIPNITGAILAPGGKTSFTITTTFEATAGSDCQGRSALIVVVVTAAGA